MRTYLTPEELAQQLKVEVADVTSLVSEGKLRAIRIGKNIRILEDEVIRLHDTCAAVPAEAVTPEHPRPPESNGIDGAARWCSTRSGKARFKVVGSIDAGAVIWPGQLRYSIEFPKSFFDELLARFEGETIPVGGKFDDPGHGSLGEFIQDKLGIKLNPAVYLAALLIDEGYASIAGRGRIMFLRKALHTALL